MFGFDRGFGSFRFMRESVLLRHDLRDSFAMRRILWASTLGYFMSQMMNPEATLYGDNQTFIFDDAAVASARAFFLNYVSAMGPAPVFRVGAVPYGVLPAISISRMAAKTGENGTAIQVMSRLLPYWRDAAAKVPKVPRNPPNPHIDLMRVISQKSRSDGAYVRNSVGVQAVTNIFQLAPAGLRRVPERPRKDRASGGWIARSSRVERGADLRAHVHAFHHAARRPAHHGTSEAGKAGQRDPSPANPTDPPVNPTDPLNYLAFLGSLQLPLAKVIRQEFMENVAPPGELTPLLYLMARHAMLLEMVDIGRRSPALSAFFASKGHKRLDFELFNISVVAAAQAPNIMVDILSAAPPGAPAGQGISVFTAIRDNKSYTSPPTLLDPTSQFFDLQLTLANLSELDVRDLERLLMETLDLAAHRFDAL